MRALPSCRRARDGRGVLAVLTLVASLGASRPLLAETVVYVVRHGEKITANEKDPDPPLSEAGHARARTLAHVLGEAGIAAVYMSEWRRTQQTADPIAKARGLVPVQLGAKDPAALVARLRRDHPNQSVLVVSHSNVIPELLTALGDPRAPKIDDHDYDDLFVLVLGPKGPITVQKLRYGAPTP